MHFKTQMLKNDYVSFFCRFISSVWWDMYSCRNSPYDNVYFIYHIHDEKKGFSSIYLELKKRKHWKNYEFVCCWEYLWPKRKYTPCLVLHDSYKKANIISIPAITEFARNIAFKHIMRSWPISFTLAIYYLTLTLTAAVCTSSSAGNREGINSVRLSQVSATSNLFSRLTM